MFSPPKRGVKEGSTMPMWGGVRMRLQWDPSPQEPSSSCGWCPAEFLQDLQRDVMGPSVRSLTATSKYFLEKQDFSSLHCEEHF